jgi:site-specific recombinase XerD
MKRSEPYLWRRGNWYSFQIAIPRDLKGCFRRANGHSIDKIVEPLETESLFEAKRRRDDRLALWRARFDRARQGAPLTLVEMESEAAETYEYLLAKLEMESQRGGTQEEVNLDAHLDNIITALDAEDWEYVAPEIGAIERRRKVKIDLSSPTYGQLASALLNAQALALSNRLKFLHGEAVEAPTGFLVTAGIDPITMKPLTPPRVSGTVGRVEHPVSRSNSILPFSEASEEYLAEKQRDPNVALRSQTILQHRAIYRLFIDFTDDAAVDAVTPRVASEFLAEVGKLKASWAVTMKGGEKMPLRELFLRYSGKPGLSNRTLNKYSGSISQVFRHLRKTGKFAGANPFEEQRFKMPKKADNVIYSDDELATLFGSAMFKQPVSDPMAWVMLISLHSGLRIEEASQLLTSDLRQEQNIWVFHIREGQGKKLKTDYAARIIPIHSRLIELGLLDYARTLPEGQLFPTLLRSGPDARAAKNLSTRFIRYRHSLGIERAKLNFHTFRKQVETALDRAGIAEHDIKALMGHSRGFSLNTYSAGPDLLKLQGMIEKVHYPSLATA